MGQAYLSQCFKVRLTRASKMEHGQTCLKHLGSLDCWNTQWQCYVYSVTYKQAKNGSTESLEHWSQSFPAGRGGKQRRGEGSLRLISLTASTTQSVNIVKTPPSITRHVICNNKQIFARCPAVASLSSLFEGETTFFAVHRNSRPCLRAVCLGQS